MHKYLRAVGFSNIHTRAELTNLLKESIENAQKKQYVSMPNDSIFSEFSLEVAKDIGIAVRGEFDDENRFLYEYYFPYLKGNHISSMEEITIERHAEKESYAGVCDELKVGVSLIFYLQNMISYIKLKNEKKLPIAGTSLTLAALSTSGSIMMPIMKDEESLRKNRQNITKRRKLMQKARRGDEEAMESLTLDDMDTYTNVSKKIHTQDLFSIVDTCFMPYGVECDMYSIIGEIIECEKRKNVVTKEELWFMTINCNDLLFDLCMNAEDLYGEPQIGRRFKGSIWLQGTVNFPNES